MAKILVVDDEAGIRKALKRFLQEKGHEVTTARNGFEALKKLKEAPDIVLLDIMMPGMKGLQVLDRIKEIAPSADVIIVTGSIENIVGLESFRIGTFEFVTKPIDLKHLEEVINFKILHRSPEEQT